MLFKGRVIVQINNHNNIHRELLYSLSIVVMDRGSELDMKSVLVATYVIDCLQLILNVRQSEFIGDAARGFKMFAVSLVQLSLRI